MDIFSSISYIICNKCKGTFLSWDMVLNHELGYVCKKCQTGLEAEQKLDRIIKLLEEIRDELQMIRFKRRS